MNNAVVGFPIPNENKLPVGNWSPVIFPVSFTAPYFFLLAFLSQFYKAPIITTSITWNLASREILLLIGWPNIYNICRCYEPLSPHGGFLLLDSPAHIFLWQSRARSPSLLLTLTRILLRSPFHPFHSLLPSRILSPFSSLVAEPLHSW